LTVHGRLNWERVKKAPFLEVLTSGVIILSDVLIAPQLRTVSDMLFLEGMTISVIGALIAGRVSEVICLPSFVRRRDDVQSRRDVEARKGSLTSLLGKKTGLRILIVGLILVAAAVVIGEGMRPR